MAPGAEPIFECGAVMRGLSSGFRRATIFAVVGVVSLVALMDVAAAGAATVGVDVSHGQTLVERGRAPSGVRVCLQAPARTASRWHDLACARSRARRGFVLRWKVPAAFRSSLARIAYVKGGLHVVRHLRLEVVSKAPPHRPLPLPLPTPGPLPIPTATSPLPAPTLISPSVIPPTVLQDYALHLVFWTPPGSSVDSDVQPAVTQLETDIQAALGAGQTNNIFSVPGLYAGGDPRIASIDTTRISDPIPTDGIETYCQGIAQPCATGAQIGDEVAHLSAQNGWGSGAHDLTLIILGQPVLACVDAGTCSQNSEPCGFHSYALASNQAYAYALVIMSGADAACGGGGTEPPDESYAIALIGHEQNEAVADPNAAGTEIADPCEGHFGENGINGHEYALPYLLLPSGQCSIVDQFVATLDATFTVSPGSPRAGQPVTFTPAAQVDPGGAILYEAWCFGDVAGPCTQAEGTVTHTYAAAGSYTVIHYVEDIDGQTQQSQQTVTVG